MNLGSSHARKRCKRIDRRLKLAIHLERLHDESVSSMLRPRKREDVLDEISETLRFLIDDAERSLTLRFGAKLSVAKQLREQPDLRKRCAELVRNSGDEVDAKLCKLLLSPKLIDRS